MFQDNIALNIIFKNLDNNYMYVFDYVVLLHLQALALGLLPSSSVYSLPPDPRSLSSGGNAIIWSLMKSQWWTENSLTNWRQWPGRNWVMSLWWKVIDAVWAYQVVQTTSSYSYPNQHICNLNNTIHINFIKSILM